MTSPSNSGPSAPVTGVQGAGFCASCGAALAVGARFCHRCGTPFGQARPESRGGSTSTGSSVASILPWGVAFVALLALVANFAGKNFGSAKGSSVDGSSNALPTSAIDGSGGGGAPVAASGSSGGQPPNIATMSPGERASRLYIRIMTYAEAGKTDSVQFFAPMAMASHEMLTAPTIDERYHYGRIAEVTGNPTVAKAQAESILKERSTSLLGLLLSARVARLTGDNATARAFDQRLLQALEPELATKLTDYDQHRIEIDRAVADARKLK